MEKTGDETMKLRLMNHNDYDYIEKLYKDAQIMKWITGYPLSDEEIQNKWKNILSWDHQKGYGYYLVYDDQHCIGIGCLKPFQNDVEIGYMYFLNIGKGVMDIVCVKCLLKKF